MEEDGLHRLVHGRAGQRVGTRRRDEVVDGLGNAPEHQADAHAAAEQLRKPREVRELGLVFIVAELYVAVFAKPDSHGIDDHAEHRKQVQPPEAAGEHIEKNACNIIEHGWGHRAEDHERSHNGGGDDQHRPIFFLFHYSYPSWLRPHPLREAGVCKPTMTYAISR